MKLKPCTSWALLGVLTALGSVGVEAQVPERHISEADAAFPEAFSMISGLRELADGRVMIADPLGQTLVVVDFEAARSALQSTLDKLAHVDLNEHEGFAGLNPTAEVVARYVFDRLRDEGLTAIRRVDVTEAPGCSATFEC